MDHNEEGIFVYFEHRAVERRFRKAVIDVEHDGCEDRSEGAFAMTPANPFRDEKDREEDDERFYRDVSQVHLDAHEEMHEHVNRLAGKGNHEGERERCSEVHLFVSILKIHLFANNRCDMDQMRWILYRTADAAWGAMLEACRAARRSIEFEQYIFQDDAAGEPFLRAFEERARSGVAVRILIDGVGGFFLSTRAVGRLRGAGAKLRFFKPLRSWMPHRASSWFFRDHRKLLVVDGEVGFVGGAGVHTRMSGWRETHMRFKGPLVPFLSDSFERMWRFAETRMFQRFPPQPFSEDGFTLMTSAPRLRERYVRRALLFAIRSARRSVYCTTPYFVPDLRLLTLLKRAARRGVDVRLLVPAVSDRLVADVAAGSYFDLLFRDGVRVYQYDRNRVLHSKVVVIDDAWATVGSANLDNLSLRLNYELNVTSIHEAFIRELKAQFTDDIQLAHEVHPEAWRRRPLYRKALEALTWPIHGIL